jgi:hypothetical protein
MRAEWTARRLATTVTNGPSRRRPDRPTCQSPGGQPRGAPDKSGHDRVTSPARPARPIDAGRAMVGTGGRGPIGGTSLSCGISSSGRGWRADGKRQPSRTVIPATDEPRFPGRRPGGIPAPAVRPARPRLHAAPAHGPPAGRPGTGSPAAPLRRPPRGGWSTRGVRRPARRPEGSIAVTELECPP